MRRIMFSAELVEQSVAEGASTRGRALAITNGLPEGCHLVAASFNPEAGPGGGCLILAFAEPSDPPGRAGEIRLIRPTIHEVGPTPAGRTVH